ncbi:hypothetical protein TNCV_627601 [Trichonephila clavipes]|nr:hypothetical protein TNCV_627601 [Trichonephila clavipes]
MGRLSGIRFWNYKRENVENKSKQEESSKEGTGLREVVLPDIMMMMMSITLQQQNYGDAPRNSETWSRDDTYLHHTIMTITLRLRKYFQTQVQFIYLFTQKDQILFEGLVQTFLREKQEIMQKYMHERENTIQHIIT